MLCTVEMDIPFCKFTDVGAVGREGTSLCGLWLYSWNAYCSSTTWPAGSPRDLCSIRFSKLTSAIGRLGCLSGSSSQIRVDEEQSKRSDLCTAFHVVTIPTLYMFSLNKHWSVWGKRPVSTEYGALHIKCLLMDIFMGQYIKFYISDKTKFTKGRSDANLSATWQELWPSLVNEASLQ